MNQTEALTCLHLGLKVKPVHWNDRYLCGFGVIGNSQVIRLYNIKTNRVRGCVSLNAFQGEQFNYEYELVV